MYRDRATALGALALALGLAYGASFGNSFHYDDFHSIVENPHIRSLERVPGYFTDPAAFSAMPERAMYRPLLLATFALNYALGGYAVAGYHLVNWLVHLGCAMLVYGLGCALGARPYPALAGALFFALHPINAEAVNYISSRSESLAALFSLAALLGYVHWRQRGTGLLWAFSLAAFSAAVFSKSVAVGLPVALLAYERWGRAPEKPRHLWLYHAVCWVVVAGYMLLARSWLGASLAAPVRGLGEQLATQAKAAAYYAQLIAVPVRLSVEHPFTVAESWAAAPVLLAGAGLVSALFLASRKPLLLLLGTWAVLPLLPASLMPLNVLVNEHRLYLPLAFLGVGLGLGMGRWAGRRGSVLLLVALGLATALCYGRSQVWRDELTLWTDAVRKAPGMYRAHLHLGGALEEVGRTAQALSRYDRALALAPDMAEVHYNRGNALVKLKRPTDAGAAYQQALALDPVFKPALVNLAALYQDVGQLAAAESLLRAAVAAYPQVADVHRRLGALRKRQGHDSEAEASYMQALALDPHLAEAHYNLGNLAYDRGLRERAARRYQKVVELDPHHAGAYRNLGELQLAQGYFEAAIATWSEGLRRLPGEVIFYYGLGRALEAQGKTAAAVQHFQHFLQRGALSAEQAAALRQRIRALGSPSR